MPCTPKVSCYALRGGWNAKTMQLADEKPKIRLKSDIIVVEFVGFHRPCQENIIVNGRSIQQGRCVKQDKMVFRETSFRPPLGDVNLQSELPVPIFRLGAIPCCCTITHRTVE